MDDNMVQVLYVKPDKLPEIIEIKNELSKYQELVGGWVEEAYLFEDPDVVLLCNEEGKINNLQFNRDIGYDIIAGPFLVVGINPETERWDSLSREQILKYKERFNEKSIHNTYDKLYKLVTNQKINHLKDYKMER